MPKIKRLHFKDLNALRFIAFTPVFLFFCMTLLKSEKVIFSNELFGYFKLMSIGSFDFFFFLSSFLLTSLAIREYKYKNKFSLKSFYVRRIIRVIPLLVVLITFFLYLHSKIIDLLKLTKNDIPPIKWGNLGQPIIANNNNYHLYK